MIDLSIIIVNWNVCHLLEACLQSVRKHIDLEPECFEVFVVDNNSSDDSARMVREKFPEFDLTVNDENVGFGRANNQAFQRSRGRCILLLNPDAELQSGAVRQMLKIMREDAETGILGARLINTDGSFQRSSGGALPTLTRAIWHHLFLYEIFPCRWGPAPSFLREDSTGTFDIGWVSGAALMLRREAVGKSIFDDRFFLYGEDLELCDRVQSSGWHVRYTSDATVMHHLRQSVFRHSSSEILAAVVKGNRAYFQLKYGRLKTWIYDLILSIGYLIRWPPLALLSKLRPHENYEAIVKANRRYALTSLKSVFRMGRL